MTKYQLELIRRALELLHRLVPDDEPHEGESPQRRCPVTEFAKRYLVRQPGSDLTSAELFQFYDEVSATGEVEALGKAEFLRRLPEVLEALFGVKKNHCIRRGGQRVRGFKNIGMRESAIAPSVLELEPE